jgi:flagellar basal body rod protein FlgG
VIEGLYKSAWGAFGAQIRHEVVANNMANVNTVGFKPDWVAFRSYMSAGQRRGEPVRPDRRVLWAVGGGSMIAETRTALRGGPIQTTGQSTDLAILGDRGFFAVEKDGEVRYTRAGDFRVGTDGKLITADGGWHLLDDAGGHITVGGADFTVGADGQIRELGEEADEIARIGLVDFDDPGALLKTGRALFAAPDGVGPTELASGSRIEQGALEMSSANPAETMVNMIEAMRAYEANITFVRMQDQLLGRAVSEIARVGA